MTFEFFAQVCSFWFCRLPLTLNHIHSKKSAMSCSENSPAPGSKLRVVPEGEESVQLNSSSEEVPEKENAGFTHDNIVPVKDQLEKQETDVVDRWKGKYDSQYREDQKSIYEVRKEFELLLDENAKKVKGKVKRKGLKPKKREMEVLVRNKMDQECQTMLPMHMKKLTVKM